MAFSLKNIFSALTSNTTSSPKRVVGIDFGSSSVKVVEVELTENALTLTSYGELQLGPYADSDLGRPTVLEAPKRIEALVDVLRESNIKAKDGVLALQLSTSFVTVMSLAAKVDEDIAPRVRVEARKYIPVPITDVTLDWAELSQLGEADTNVREVLIAAIHNEALAASNALMQSVQMVSQPSEIELFAAIRAITKPSDDAIAVLDLGAQTSKMYVSENGSLRRIHRVHVGGVTATERIAEFLSVSFTEAENLKRNYTSSSPKAAEVKKAFVTSYERPMQEFKRVLEQYELRAGKNVSRIVVCGGTAAFEELPRFASYIFDREVVRANPFNKIAYPAFMEDALAEIAPTFTVALGCALRPFEG